MVPTGAILNNVLELKLLVKVWKQGAF